jgi:hypothetical protein
MSPSFGTRSSIHPLARRRAARFPYAWLPAATAALLATVAARPGHAEQFILVDAMITYTWDDAMNSKPDKSHFYVNEANFLNKMRPLNWLSPVDYRNGTLHVRAEVFEHPPGGQSTGWTLCYIPNAGGYGCADTTYYTSTGIFERDVKMTEWWNNTQLQWDKGVKQVDMIYAINDSGSGHVTNFPDLKDRTTPTRVRVTMVQVSAGAQYDPSILPAMGTTPGGSDGGTPGAGTGGSGGSAVDSGARGGSGGASGTGGTTTGGSAGSSGSGGASGTTGGNAGAGGTSGGSGGSSGTTSGSGGSSPGARPTGTVTSSGCQLAAAGDVHDLRGLLTTAFVVGAGVWARRRRR